IAESRCRSPQPQGGGDPPLRKGAKMRVLVTGNRGYIGAIMTPLLSRAGHDVVGLDVDLYRDCGYAPGGVLPDTPTIMKDVRDVTHSDLQGFDAIIHLAARSNDPLG